MSYKGTFSNDYSVNEEEQYYTFTVKGTFGAAKVELICEGLPVSKILRNEEELNRRKKIEEEMKMISEKIEDLRTKAKE